MTEYAGDSRESLEIQTVINSTEGPEHRSSTIVPCYTIVRGVETDSEVEQLAGTKEGLQN